MAKQYTREQLTALTVEEFNAMTKEQQQEVLRQGREYKEQSTQR